MNKLRESTATQLEMLVEKVKLKIEGNEYSKMITPITCAAIFGSNQKDRDSRDVKEVFKGNDVIK